MEKKKIIKIGAISVISTMFIFLILFSNIIPARTFSIFKNSYKNYDGVYVNDDERTAFAFVKGSQGVFIINSVPYMLLIKDNNKTTFNFRAFNYYSENTSLEQGDEISLEQYVESTDIKLKFNDNNSATISGNVYGEEFSINLTKKNISFLEHSNVQSGALLL